MIKELKLLLKKYWFALTLCILSIIVLDYFFDTVCYMEFFFGVPCPFCGMTRAAILLLIGHPIKSFQMHPLLILVPIGILLYILLKVKTKYCITIIKVYVIMCMIIFVVFYIYRMNIYYPNVEPMVYREDNFLNMLVNH